VAAIMTKRAVTFLLVCGTATSAFADGKISGRVVDVSDQPLRDVSVVISGSTGVEATVVTDPTGHYVANVKPGPHTVMFTFGNKHVTAKVDVTDNAVAKLDGMLEIAGEVIDVLDTPRPVKYAKPKSDPLAIPKYSDKAVLTDAWSKAWLLLDVDERGVVTRVKFLKRPGNDLDDIAIKHAFGLKFDPARNKFGYPTRSYIVWPLEWPAVGWMQENELPTNRLPNFLAYEQFDAGSRWSVAFSSYPPCGGGPWHFHDIGGAGGNHATRDCSVPDLSRANAGEPWILRDASMPADNVPALAVDPKKELRDDIDSAHRNRIVAIATGATAIALVGATIISYTHYSAWNDRVDADNQQRATLLPPGQLEADQRHAHRWSLATFGLGLGAMVGGITSGYFWSRATPSVSIQGNGEAMINMSGRF
jgi:Carboxypeptidase regulatory-like domain